MQFGTYRTGSGKRHHHCHLDYNIKFWQEIIGSEP